jgi:transcriptional regulator of acetoin/glycerol metabolism
MDLLPTEMGASSCEESSPEALKVPDLSSISERDWSIARDRYEAIEPLLHAGRSTPQEVTARARAVGRNRATLYRWLKAFGLESLQEVRAASELRHEPKTALE